MEKTKYRKSLDELTLMDRFLFAQTMENPENLKILLDIILEDDIELKHLPQAERELRLDEVHHSARIDVWAEDVNNTVYDAEVQKRNTGNLPKRSRFYQAMLDQRNLKIGEEDYNTLSKIYVIMIMPFDLFGKGLYRYTFVNTCKEIPGLELEDDGIRIFLNTKGKNDDEVSEKLIQLLHYMEYTKDGSECIEFQDEQLRRLQQNVQELRQNAEMGVKYMRWLEELAEQKKEGKIEGKQGDIISILNELGVIQGDLQERIMEQQDIAVLDAWVIKAARAESIEDFVNSIAE